MKTSNVNDQSNPYDFDAIEPWFIDDIRINGKRYRLLEPSAGDAAKYRAARTKGTRMEMGAGDEKAVVMDGSVSEVELILVQGCLREVQLPGGGQEVLKEVPMGTVRGFPGRATSKLYADLKKAHPWLDFAGEQEEGEKSPKVSPSTSTESSG